MNYWRWNIPIRRSPFFGGGTTPDPGFSLAEKLNITQSDLDEIKAFAKKGKVSVKAGDIVITNPWNNDGENELSDLQVWKRWNTDALLDYCHRVLDIICN